MRLGAEQLHDDHGGADGAILAQVQRLGPQAEDDLGPRARGRHGHRRGQRHRCPGEGHAQRAAPARLPGGSGRPALDEHPVHEVHAGAAEETGHERVGRVRVERLRRRHLLQPPLAHDRDAVAHRHGLDLVVRDVEGGGRQPRLQLHDVGPGLGAQRRVEVGQRLVHEEDEGLAHDGPGERHPLALAARELPRLAVDQRGQPEGLGGPLHLERPLGLVDAALAERELDVLGHGQVGVERVALEDHGHVAVLGVDVVDDAVTDGDGPTGDFLEPGHQAQGGRLAAARRAEEHQQLAVRDVQGQVVDRGGVAELLGDAVEADLCQRAPFVRAARLRQRIIALAHGNQPRRRGHAVQRGGLSWPGSSTPSTRRSPCRWGTGRSASDPAPAPIPCRTGPARRCR